MTSTLVLNSMLPNFGVLLLCFLLPFHFIDLTLSHSETECALSTFSEHVCGFLQIASSGLKLAIVFKVKIHTKQRYK